MSKNYATDNTSVFIDSDAFFNQLAADIERAQNSVYIQCMSFEADSVGTKLIELLAGKPTIQRTLLIDSYSKFVVNDVFLPSPFGLLNKNNALAERRALPALLDRARTAGIEVHFTNPMGFLMRKYPARNHKKLITIDHDITYLGGLNFTEHNFRWSDLMIRHAEPDLNRAVWRSLQSDLYNTELSPIHEVNADNTLFFLNGWKTRQAYRELLKTFENAKKVVAISPYISYPMLDAISEVENHTVILPSQNNKQQISIIHNLPRYNNINYVYAEGEMVHTKLILIDDKTAVYGSSNFDTISYLFEKEIVLKRTDPNLVKQLSRVASNLINR